MQNGEDARFCDFIVKKGLTITASFVIMETPKQKNGGQQKSNQRITPHADGGRQNPPKYKNTKKERTKKQWKNSKH